MTAGSDRLLFAAPIFHVTPWRTDVAAHISAAVIIPAAQLFGDPLRIWRDLLVGARVIGWASGRVRSGLLCRGMAPVSNPRRV